jgi:hypothetical protein
MLVNRLNSTVMAGRFRSPMSRPSTSLFMYAAAGLLE